MTFNIHGVNYLQNLLNALRAHYLASKTIAGVTILVDTDSFDAYRRGPFAMYALREHIGEDLVNLTLRNLLDKFSSDRPPSPM